jgi:translation initiation factor IF-3
MNSEIEAPQIRLIDDEGTMLGVMSPREALAIAQSKGLDLIEIAPTAKPPTCKIMDYGKWKYESKKKDKAAKKNQSIITVKEVQVRPRTDDHDLETKMKHARRFLLEGDKVKVNLRFSGREMAHQEIGLKTLKKFAESLNDISIVESHPKLEGRQMFLLLGPDPVKIKEYEKLNKRVAKIEKAEKSESAGAAESPEKSDT